MVCGIGLIDFGFFAAQIGKFDFTNDATNQ
jgi:hypothetical protein